MRENSNFETGSVSQRILYWLAGIAVIGFILRAYPFIAAGSAWRVPVDYDNGVYFSAAALLWKNIWPYQDYVFVHPPGILLFYSPVAAWSQKIDPAVAFVLSRWLAATVGGVNAFLAGRAALGMAGPWAAVFAAGAYATHAEVIGVERGPFLEPALNLACLSLANVLIPGERKDSQFGTTAAKGFLAGLAIVIKIWGGIWFVAAVTELVRRKSWRTCFAFLGSGLLTATLFTMPFVLRAPRDALNELVFFHLWRPPDGPTGLGVRVAWIFRWHLLTSILGLVGAALSLWLAGEGRSEGRDPPTARYWATGYFLLIAGFLLSRTYWNQYNAHLAPAESVMAGFAFAKISDYLRRLNRGTLISIFVALGALTTSVRQPLLSLKERDDSLISLGRVIRAEVPRSACLLPFEQSWGLVAGRLPQRLPSGAVWVDPYAAMLLDASEAGKSFTSATEAFQSASSQHRIRASLESCRFASLGSRGDWQLSAETKSWFKEHFQRRYENHSRSSVDLWERTEQTQAR